MSHLSKLLKIIFVISLTVYVATFFIKDPLPSPDQILPALSQNPLQTETGIKPFDVTKKGVTYHIEPKYSYELNGLVVSYTNVEAWYSRFKDSDPLNTRDLCVLWGKNAANDMQNRMKFLSQEFVCYGQFKSKTDPSWYTKFSNDELSNNHLLPQDDNVYQTMKQVKKGDQIHFKGYLVKYTITDKNGSQSYRDSSISRTDEGMGSCETVYVTNFEIIKPSKRPLAVAHTVSGYASLILAGLLVILFLTPDKSIVPPANNTAMPTSSNSEPQTMEEIKAEIQDKLSQKKSSEPDISDS